MMMTVTQIEWLGGPWDGSTFDAPDGVTQIEITLSAAVLPNRYIEAESAEIDDAERDVQVPKGSVPTRTLTLPIHRRMSDGVFIVKYSEITDD
jgi:hypothetical protein